MLYIIVMRQEIETEKDYEENLTLAMKKLNSLPEEQKNKYFSRAKVGSPELRREVAALIYMRESIF